MSMKQNLSPWSARLFGEFAKIWGSQKVASMWADCAAEDINAMWEPQIRRFDGDTIKKAIQALIDQGKDWPPTLPEFVSTCRQFMPPYGKPPGTALMAPGEVHTDAETARQNIIKVRGMLAGAMKRMPE